MSCELFEEFLREKYPESKPLGGGKIDPDYVVAFGKNERGFCPSVVISHNSAAYYSGECERPFLEPPGMEARRPIIVTDEEIPRLLIYIGESKLNRSTDSGNYYVVIEQLLLWRLSRGHV